MTPYEMAEWLLHHPDFNPEKLISFDSLVRSHVMDNMLEAIKLIPNINDQLKTVIITNNFSARESQGDPYEFSVLIIGNINDAEALDLLASNEELFKDYEEFSIAYFNGTQIRDMTQTLLELCSNWITSHPGTRNFEAATDAFRR